MGGAAARPGRRRGAVRRPCRGARRRAGGVAPRPKPVRAARQPAAGHRAGGGADDALHSRAAPRTAGATARPAQGRTGLGSTPADAAGDDRLVARPPRRRRASALPPPGRVRRRLHVRGGRGCLRGRSGQPAVAARQEPAAQARGRTRAALLDAGDDPRVRGGAARGSWRSGRAARPPRRLLPRARRAGGAGDVGAPATDLVRPARFRARQPPSRADNDPGSERGGIGDEARGSSRALLERAATSGKVGAGSPRCSRPRRGREGLTREGALRRRQAGPAHEEAPGGEAPARGSRDAVRGGRRSAGAHLLALPPRNGSRSARRARGSTSATRGGGVSSRPSTIASCWRWRSTN